ADAPAAATAPPAVPGIPAASTADPVRAPDPAPADLPASTPTSATAFRHAGLFAGMTFEHWPERERSGTRPGGSVRPRA
ncbi:hypothetical protein ACTWQJ_15910, partial [Streptomyces sp. KR55]